MKTPVTVRFVSGREEKFEVDLWGGSGGEERLKAFAANPNLLLQTGDEVLVIPASAIECISIRIQKGDSRFKLIDVRPATRLG
jgi:hypothetical protein